MSDPTYWRSCRGTVHITLNAERIYSHTICGIHIETPCAWITDVPTGARTCQRCFPGGDS